MSGINNPLDAIGLSVESGLGLRAEVSDDSPVDDLLSLTSFSDQQDWAATTVSQRPDSPMQADEGEKGVQKGESEDPFGLFNGVAQGDFTEVESFLNAKTKSQTDLVAFLCSADGNGLGDCEMMETAAAEATEANSASSTVDMLQPSLGNLIVRKVESCLMEVEPISMDEVLHHLGVDQNGARGEGVFTSLLESPSMPREAADHHGSSVMPPPPQLPSLPVLLSQPQKMQQKQQQKQQQQRFANCPPLLNSFETLATEATDADADTIVDDGGFNDVGKQAALMPSPTPPPPMLKKRGSRSFSSPFAGLTGVSRRRGNKIGGRGEAAVSKAASEHEKSYESVCRKNRIFDSDAKARYRLEAQLNRDCIVNDIVRYVKHCLEGERDRVHRFLIVMLVDGQMERGPYSHFFHDAVYFCNARKERQDGADASGPMFHIRQSAYVGLLWGRFKGNECYDYATLGDAIKSVKSKPSGDQYFVDPDFGSQSGKPKRLFQFGQVAVEDTVRYRDNARRLDGLYPVQ